MNAVKMLIKCPSFQYIAICILITVIKSSFSSYCPGNLEYTNCGTLCPKTCDNLNQNIACPLICKEGCFCRSGLVLLDKNIPVCILPQFCPRIGDECDRLGPQYNCQPKCRTLCSRFNGIINQVVCFKQCIVNCVCSGNFIRLNNGQCITSKNCVRRCPKNEKEVECVNPCQKCEYLGKGCPIKVICQRGCDCIEGYYRNNEGVCIPQDQCPSEICGPGLYNYPCKPTCKDTCENYNDPSPVCTKICIPGCACSEGLVLRKDGKCVVPEDCAEKICGPGEDFYKCKPTCKHTCENYNDNPPICPLICSPGCACQDGLLLRKDGKCVLQNQCNFCQVNENPVACEQPKNCVTCKHKEECPTLACKPGCNCKPGYFREDGGMCIEEAMCIVEENI